MGFFKGHTTTTYANKITSFSVNTAEYGAPVPEILGTTRISGNVIYYDDFTAHEHRETHKSGKGGKSKSVSVTYTYTVATIVGLCEGEIGGIGRIWAGKNVYTYPSSEVGLTLFNGSANQKPWSYLQGRHPDKALPYNGLAYMAGVIDLGDSASYPDFNFEVRGKLRNTGDGVDVNPADYIRYVLDKVGLDKVEIDGLDNYRKYCANADMLISTPADFTIKDARDIINDIATITNAYMFWSNDRFKIVPLEDRPVGDWQPNREIEYNLTEDDFLPQENGALVTYARKDSSEIYNQFPVEYLSRENSYEKETVAYENTDDIQKYGLRQADAIDAHYLYKKSRAVRLAEQLARNAKYGRNQYTFKLDWAFCRLEVGDLVTLTDANCGLDKQLCIIDSVTEDVDGLLQFTAVSRPPMTTAKAKYDVHESERPFVDFNVSAPDTVPVIFQPPSDITTSGNELWIAGKGKSDGWGGCYIYASMDGTNYRTVGQLTNSSRCGKLISDVTADSDSITVSCNDQLISGTKEDAENANTLCWVDGECLSYTTATMDSNGNYVLTGLVRGQYNTEKAAHKANSDFVRLDSYVCHIPYSQEDVGKKIYLKFCSYNIFGANEQDMSDVNAYEYTIQPYYIPHVSNVVLRNRYRKSNDGVARYDIVVDWTPPTLNNYLEGDVWYKSNHSQGVDMVFKEGVSGDSMGFNGNWIFGGSGVNEVVIPQAIVGDTYRISVCTKDKFGNSTSPDTSPQKDILVALKTEIPNVADGFSISFGENCTATWNEVTNTDVAFYEIRDDSEAGTESVGMLARTNGTKAVLPLTNRSGTLYLFTKSAVGKYSEPAILKYSKSVPPKPNPPTVVPKLGGMAISTENIPNGCNGMVVYVDAPNAEETKSARTVNSTYSYLCNEGIYDVSIAYTDIFGEGPRSASTTCTVKVEIDQSMIKDEAISLNKVDKHLQDVFNTTIPNMEEGISQNSDSITALVKDGKGYASAIAQNSTSITSVVTNLNSKDGYKNYTALSQLNDAINLRVAKNDVINQINMTSETTTIDGKHLHVTGDTFFDKNVVVSGMIQAGAVTADKLSVDSLSAITATIGTLRTKTSGARTEIHDNLIEVYDENNVLRVRMGVW